MQVISRSQTPQHLAVSMKTSLSLGHRGIASPWSVSQSLRSTSGSHGPAYRQAQRNSATCMWRWAEIWPVEHKSFRHSTMRAGSSSSSSRFKIRPKQVNASTCDFDRCCLQSGDNTGTHLHVSRKAICQPKKQLHVSTSMESAEYQLTRSTLTR